jgi:hypothetical protein
MDLPYYGFFNVIPTVDQPKKKSEVDWDFIRGMTYLDNKIVALGEFPSMCLARVGVPHFRMPHPSGLNRRLNDPLYEMMMVELCMRYIDE